MLKETNPQIKKSALAAEYAWDSVATIFRTKEPTQIQLLL